MTVLHNVMNIIICQVTQQGSRDIEGKAQYSERPRGVSVPAPGGVGPRCPDPQGQAKAPLPSGLLQIPNRGLIPGPYCPALQVPGLDLSLARSAHTDRLRPLPWLPRRARYHARTFRVKPGCIFHCTNTGTLRMGFP